MWFLAMLGFMFISILLFAVLRQVNQDKRDAQDLIESRQANDGTGTSELM